MQSGQTYGSPRVHAGLRLADGVEVGRKRVERLMGTAGLSGQLNRRKGRTTISVPGLRTAQDLVQRDFNSTTACQLWCADITYIRTWEGWLYLASVMDAVAGGSRGGRSPITCARNWSSMHCNGCGTPTPRCRGRASLRSRLATIHVVAVHPALQPGRDRGIERVAGTASINAALESFHASLKKDLIHRRSWPTWAEARTAVLEYIETFYNRRRRHSRLEILAPVDYETRTGTGTHALGGKGAATRRARTTLNISTTTSTATKAA